MFPHAVAKPLQAMATDPRIISSPGTPPSQPNRASPGSLTPKLTSAASQATPCDPCLSHPRHQAAAAAAVTASPLVQGRHALGAASTAESPGQHSKGAGRQSGLTTMDAECLDEGPSSCGEESQQLHRPGASGASPAQASSSQPGSRAHAGGHVHHAQPYSEPGVRHFMQTPTLLPLRMVF